MLVAVGAKYCHDCGTIIAQSDLSTPAAPLATEAMQTFCTNGGYRSSLLVVKCKSCGRDIGRGCDLTDQEALALKDSLDNFFNDSYQVAFKEAYLHSPNAANIYAEVSDVRALARLEQDRPPQAPLPRVTYAALIEAAEAMERSRALVKDRHELVIALEYLHKRWPLIVPATSEFRWAGQRVTERTARPRGHDSRPHRRH